MSSDKNECCPFFIPEKWDKKTFTWDKKLFIKELFPTFFHIPFPPIIGKKMNKMYQLVEKSSAEILDKTDALVLFHDLTAFRSEIYYSVTKEVEGANNTKLSGTFTARVFDGAYNSVPKFMKKMNRYLAEQGKVANDYYIHYAYCPRCAKKYGNNYMILFAEL